MIQRHGNLLSAGESTDGVNYTLIPGTTADMDLPATTLTGSRWTPARPPTRGPLPSAAWRSASRSPPRWPPRRRPTPARQAGPALMSAARTRPATRRAAARHYTLDGTGTGITTGQLRLVPLRLPARLGGTRHSAPRWSPSQSAGHRARGHHDARERLPHAPYYSVLISPGGKSASVQWRTYDGVDNRAGTLALPSIVSPADVEIVRWQDTTLNQTFFSTLTSTDGVNWSRCSAPPRRSAWARTTWQAWRRQPTRRG